MAHWFSQSCARNWVKLTGSVLSVADHLTLEGGGGGGDFEKKFPASACRKKKIACSTNVIESLWEKKGKKISCSPYC